MSAARTARRRSVTSILERALLNSTFERFLIRLQHIFECCLLCTEHITIFAGTASYPFHSKIRFAKPCSSSPFANHHDRPLHAGRKHLASLCITASKTRRPTHTVCTACTRRNRSVGASNAKIACEANACVVKEKNRRTVMKRSRSTTPGQGGCRYILRAADSYRIRRRVAVILHMAHFMQTCQTFNVDPALCCSMEAASRSAGSVLQEAALASEGRSIAFSNNIHFQFWIFSACRRPAHLNASGTAKGALPERHHAIANALGFSTFCEVICSRQNRCPSRLGVWSRPATGTSGPNGLCDLARSPSSSARELP